MEVLDLLLNARTERQALRKKVASASYATVSLNFNLAGYPKSTLRVKQVFKIVRQELLTFLQAARIPVRMDMGVDLHNAAGDFVVFPLRHTRQGLDGIKEVLEKFEQQHPLNRLLDVDLFDASGMPVSSGKRKPCLICQEGSALICMREQRHSAEEFRKVAFGKIEAHWKAQRQQTTIRRLTSLATQALLMEVSVPEKPGLVCPTSQGAHDDMNYFSFLQSTAALSPYFADIAKLGYDWNGMCNAEILQQIRTLGLQMESAMKQSTGGVNTQKGIIFLMGFSVFAAAYVISVRSFFDTALFRQVIKLLNKDLVARELQNGWNQDASHGEKCFNKFGAEHAGGIRREVELGLPTVFDSALPLMQSLFPEGIDTVNQDLAENKLTQILLKIMTVNSDTNILFRKDLAVLNKVQQWAQRALEQADPIESDAYEQLKSYCLEQYVSPGGSADLLAISIFIYQITHSFSNNTAI